MGDPYALYAREILHLRPLDPLDADPGAAERGTLVHAALEQFLKRHPKVLPPDALDDLLEIRSEEHTSELQSLMRISYAVFCLKKKTKTLSNITKTHDKHTRQT